MSGAATGTAARVGEAVRAANADGRAALVVYLPAGYPDLATSRACLEAAVEGGADLLEVGFPYSDPLMDGPTIQAANQVALEQGLTPADDFAMCRELTGSSAVPALVMTYYNLALRYPGSAAGAAGQAGHGGTGGGGPGAPAPGPGGPDAFAAAARDAGLAGAILPDLPVEEADDWRGTAGAHDLATVFLAAPTSSNERLAALAEATTGFVYATSTLGVTGERASLSAMAAPLVERLRAVTDKPVCVGIGVTTPAHATEIAAFADGVIVGSAAVQAAGRDGPAGVRDLVAGLAAGCRRG